MTHLARETVLAAPSIWDGWTVVRRDAIDWRGPWTPVDAALQAQDQGSTDE